MRIFRSWLLLTNSVVVYLKPNQCGLLAVVAAYFKFRDEKIQKSEQKGCRERKRGVRRGGPAARRAHACEVTAATALPAARRSPGTVAVAADRQFVCDLRMRLWQSREAGRCRFVSCLIDRSTFFWRRCIRAMRLWAKVWTRGEGGLLGQPLFWAYKCLTSTLAYQFRFFLY
jgi:hypothetical protein